ncbi:MAG: DUF748 domain-containing protein, partial [Candidatus Omnitrophica bacterium]|nr:DUF748 domain-containing protein [Candidatus Omnitrophota bacterium]
MKEFKSTVKTLKAIRSTRRVILIVFLLVIILFSLIHAYLHFQGKQLITTRLQHLTQKKIEIGSFTVEFPLTIKIKDARIEGVGSIQQLFLTPDLLSLVTGHIVLRKIRVIRPELTITQGSPTDENPAAWEAVTKSIAVPTGKKKKMRLLVRQLKVRDGILHFKETNTPEQFSLTVDHIDIDITIGTIFPVSLMTNFNIKAQIPWRNQEIGKINAEGWLNFIKKDMQATVNIENIDGVALYPFYSSWVDLEKARIESAKLNFTSDIQALNNNLTAACHLSLTDIVRKVRTSEEPAQKAEKVTDYVLGVFKSTDQGKIAVDFTIRTKLDRPEFGFSSVRSAVEDKIMQARKANAVTQDEIIQLPGKLLEGLVKGAAGFSKALINGTVGVGQELKKAVEETFNTTDSSTPQA